MSKFYEPLKSSVALCVSLKDLRMLETSTETHHIHYYHSGLFWLQESSDLNQIFSYIRTKENTRKRKRELRSESETVILGVRSDYP